MHAAVNIAPTKHVHSILGCEIPTSDLESSIDDDDDVLNFKNDFAWDKCEPCY